jgi:endonuclease G, mitochondrial
MVHLVLVHGRSQQYKIPETEQRELAEATRWGLERVGAAALRTVPFSFAFYGDLYQREIEERERGEALVANPALQTELATDLVRAHDIDVDVEGELERLGFGDLTRLIAALDRHLGVGAPFIDRFMGDVAAYLDDETLRALTVARVVDRVRSANDDVVLLAHSLGSIVAYDTLVQHPELPIRVLVTFGSPLGLATVRRRLAERLTVAFPPKLPRWVNVFNREDFVCAEPLLKPLYPASDSRSVDDREAAGQGTEPSQPEGGPRHQDLSQLIDDGREPCGSSCPVCYSRGCAAGRGRITRGTERVTAPPAKCIA